MFQQPGRKVLGMAAASGHMHCMLTLKSSGAMCHCIPARTRLGSVSRHALERMLVMCASLVRAG